MTFYARIYLLLIYSCFSQTIILGTTPKYDIEEQIKRFRYLNLFLQAKSEHTIEFDIAETYESFIKHYSNGKYDIAFTSPIVFVQCRLKNSAIKPMAVIQNRGSTYYRSIIATRKDSPIQTINDLSGKIIAYGSTKSTSRYIIPQYFLTKNGIKVHPDSFFDSSKEVSLYRLKSGNVEAVTLFHETYYQNESDLKIVFESFKVPEYVFSYNSDSIEGNLFQTLQAILLDAPELIISQLRSSYTGVEPIKLTSFNHLIELAKFSENLSLPNK